MSCHYSSLYSTIRCVAFRTRCAIPKSQQPKPPITSNVNKMTINLMTEILSREDHVTLVAQVEQASNAKNLLDFIPHMLHHYSGSSSHASFTMNTRAKQFMLGVIEEMHGEPPSKVPYDNSRSNTLLLLLYVLNNKEVRNISNTECTLALRGH